MRARAGIGAVLACAALVPASARAEPPRTERFQLPSGLRVTLVADHTERRAAYRLATDLGVRDEATQPGLAGLAAAACSEAEAKDVRYRALANVAHALDAGMWERDCTASRYATTIAGRSEPDALDLMLWFEARWLAAPGAAVGPETMERALGALRRQWTRSQDVLLGGIDDATRALVHGGGTPFTAPIAADPDGLARYSPADVRAWLARFTPERASLVVVADLPLDAMRASVERAFGGLPAAAASDGTREHAAPPAAPAPSRRVIVAPVERSQVRLAWPTPEFQSPDDLALDVIARVLARRLARREAASSELVWVGARELSSAPASVFAVFASLDSHTTEDAALAILDAEVVDLREHLVPDDELRAARELVVTSWLGGLESAWQRANALVVGQVLPRAPKDSATITAAYRAVDAAMVQRVARAYLTPDRRSVLLVHIDKSAPRVGRAEAP